MPRGNWRNFSEEERAIVNKLVTEEEEKIRKELEGHRRGRKLTEDEKKLRRVIKNRATQLARARAARVLKSRLNEEEQENCKDWKKKLSLIKDERKLRDNARNWIYQHKKRKERAAKDAKYRKFLERKKEIGKERLPHGHWSLNLTPEERKIRHNLKRRADTQKLLSLQQRIFQKMLVFGVPQKRQRKNRKQHKQTKTPLRNHAQKCP